MVLVNLIEDLAMTVILWMGLITGSMLFTIPLIGWAAGFTIAAPLWPVYAMHLLEKSRGKEGGLALLNQGYRKMLIPSIVLSIILSLIFLAVGLAVAGIYTGIAFVLYSIHKSVTTVLMAGAIGIFGFLLATAVLSPFSIWAMLGMWEQGKTPLQSLYEGRRVMTESRYLSTQSLLTVLTVFLLVLGPIFLIGWLFIGKLSITASLFTGFLVEWILVVLLTPFSIAPIIEVYRDVVDRGKGETPG